VARAGPYSARSCGRRVAVRQSAGRTCGAGPAGDARAAPKAVSATYLPTAISIPRGARGSACRRPRARLWSRPCWPSSARLARVRG